MGRRLIHVGAAGEENVRDDPADAVIRKSPARADSAVTLSVVMPVYNALPYLDAAILSILAQSYDAFELVIGDDGSTDGSTEVLRRWAAREPRIRLLERRDNLGPVGSSNWVTEAAQGEFIARMDADDICHPDRLRLQMQVLRDNPEAVMAASLFEGIDQKGRLVRERDLGALASDNSFGAPFAHGSIMFRRAQFETVGGYRVGTEYWEDLDLFLRLANAGRILVLPDALYCYRFSDTSGRLHANPAKVERSLELMLACAASYSQGVDYGPLIEARIDREAGKRRLNPKVFRAIHSQVWAGKRPQMLRKMLSRAELPLDRAAFNAWLYTLLATASPRMLRFLLRQRLRLRNRGFRRHFIDGRPHEWARSAVRVT